MNDDLIEEATQIIIKYTIATIPEFQRQLRLNYYDAKKLIDDLENLGIVGPRIGSKPRKILI